MGDTMTNLKTDARLLKEMHDARKPTREEIKEQRVSFVFGSLDAKSPITREQVRKILEDA